jgi:sugar (pentulose or hexulose) kinase
MIPVIAIFDIGKTNKKLVLYDSSYRIIREVQTVVSEAEDEDGFSCEDLSLLTKWLSETWDELTGWNHIRVDALHCTAYGASFVHLDKDGNPVTPLYSYFKPIPDEISESLYNRYGGKLEFSVQTASPAMGMLNSGLQLYWLKTIKPQYFSKINTSLHLPNYCSYIFTGSFASELTSIGCHTALWNYRTNSYHGWVKDEAIEYLFPPIANEIKAGELTIDNRKIPVGVGLHDSSAALVPYLQSFQQPFILLSTGTWSVNLNPFSRLPLIGEHIQRDCLSYMTFQGTTVKASRVFLGGEHDHQVERLAEYFKCAPDTYKNIEYNSKLIEELTAKGLEADLELKPELMKGTGPTPEIESGLWNLSAFRSYEEAYHQLMLDLVCIVGASIYLITEGNDSIDLFVDGGFSNNEIFMNMLASIFPKVNVRSSQVAQATALGAALMMHRYWEGNESVSEKIFSLKRYHGMHENSIQSYFTRKYGRYNIVK